MKRLVNSDDSLLNELLSLIEHSQQHLISQANSTLTLLFWKIGNCINTSILHEKRAEYGKQIVVILSRQLTLKHGKKFEEKNLRRMLQFADQFSDEEIVVTLSRQLSWSHFLAIIPLKSIEAKMYYAQKVKDEILGVRENA